MESFKQRDGFQHAYLAQISAGYQASVTLCLKARRLDRQARAIGLVDALKTTGSGCMPTGPLPTCRRMRRCKVFAGVTLMKRQSKCDQDEVLVKMNVYLAACSVFEDKDGALV